MRPQMKSFRASAPTSFRHHGAGRYEQSYSHSHASYSYPLPESEPFCVWLGNLPAEATPSDIVSYLSAVIPSGPLLQAKDIRFGRIHKHKYTCAYVDFYSRRDMRRALEAIDHPRARLFMGRQVEIDINEGVQVDRDLALRYASMPVRDEYAHDRHAHGGHGGHGHGYGLGHAQDVRGMSASWRNTNNDYAHNHNHARAAEQAHDQNSNAQNAQGQGQAQGANSPPKPVKILKRPKHRKLGKPPKDREASGGGAAAAAASGGAGGAAGNASSKASSKASAKRKSRFPTLEEDSYKGMKGMKGMNGSPTVLQHYMEYSAKKPKKASKRHEAKKGRDREAKSKRHVNNSEFNAAPGQGQGQGHVPGGYGQFRGKRYRHNHRMDRDQGYGGSGRNYKGAYRDDWGARRGDGGYGGGGGGGGGYGHSSHSNHSKKRHSYGGY